MLNKMIGARIASLLAVVMLSLAMLGSFGGGTGLAQNLGAIVAQETGQTDETLSRLVDVLKDDAARNKLIGELEGVISSENAGVDGVGPASVEAVEDVSLGRRIALYTQNTVEDAYDAVNSLWRKLTLSDSAFAGLSGEEFGILLAALPGLFLVISITIAVFVVLRRLAFPLYRRLGARAEDLNLFQTALLFIGTNLLDALIVVVAWAIGYAVSVLAVGELGQIGIRQTLYLNAFLLVELVKVAIRALLAPISSGLRVVPIGDLGARALSRILTLIVSIIGYGHLLVVPIVNQSASYAAGNGVTALVSVVVLLYLIFVVIRRRVVVAEWLVWLFSRVATPEPSVAPLETVEEFEAAPLQERRETSSVLTSLAYAWHWFALVYLGVMFVIVMTQPAAVIFNATIGSAKVLGALVLASLVSGVLTRSIAKGISLPADINQKLPLLQSRLNTVAPRALRALRLVLLSVVALFIFDIIGLLDMRAWLESQVGLQFTGTLISVALILLIAVLISLAFTSWIDYQLNPEYGSVPTAREVTLLTLFRNAGTIALIILTLMFTLSEIGLDIGPLLASAGVLGLAIGFGAQKLVQDIITGVFIQFENAINVGDVITVGGTTGGVEKLTVRSVSLRDVHGVFHIIPFSSVDMVSNFSRDFSFFVCDMGVAYRENIEDVKAAMHDGFDELMQDRDIRALVLDELEWFGLQSFGDSAIVLRARIKTLPGQQWGVGRAYNGILKRIFDERNIEIPFPHQTIFFGESKDGSTQAIKLAKGTDSDEVQ